MATEWFIVLRPDGTVEAAEGGAPVTWIGKPLGALPDVPMELRRASEDLLDERSAVYARRKRVHLDGRTVELLVVEALPLRKTHTRVDDLLMRTLDVFAAQAHSREVTLETEHASDVPAAVVVDAEKIAWVLTTLVGNALRYVADRKEPRVGIRLSWDSHTDELLITVEDNGPGITPHRVRWLFDQDPANGRPAGLALVMVRDVVVAHRGSISVSSRIGEGTTFTIRLPRH